MNDIIFREYDIRGKVGTELDIDQVYALTLAIAYYFAQQNPLLRTVAVGMDGRTHSPAIKDEVCRALLDSGLSVIFLDVCPSPVLYFALHTLSVDAGIMITASHNPSEYNGFKICLGKLSVWGDQIREIRSLFKQKKRILVFQKSGSLTAYDSNTDYINWLIAHFHALKNMTLPFVIDCANGVAGVIIPRLIAAMGWQNVQVLCAQVDGTYPNHEADPTIESNMLEVRELLYKTNAKCGIGFDGDADRMAAMTKEGFLIPGDQLLTVFAQSLSVNHKNAYVVADIKSSQRVLTVLNNIGINLSFSPSGHSIIKNEMKKYNALLAGELSCHFFFADRYFGYDDGIYAMMRLLEILCTTGKSLTALIEPFSSLYGTREIRMSYEENIRDDIIGSIKNAFHKRSDVQLVCIDGVRVVFPYGWAVVRASNTQPVLCIRLEADTPDQLNSLKNDFIGLLMPFFDKNVLEKEFDYKMTSAA